ncbi:MAG: Asp-tRNA(Asn)/Glu-tRNA(Gln) amidotransferase subunit GatC [Bacteroidota bacterium]
MREINDELMDKLLYMARLELSQQARVTMAEELNNMTRWLQKLGEVDVRGIEPLTSINVESNRLREDVPMPPLAVSKVLANAPDRSSHYFRTPTVKKEG